MSAEEVKPRKAEGDAGVSFAGQRHAENPLKIRTDRLLMSKLENNEVFADNVSYLQQLVDESDVTERKLRLKLEDRELAMNRKFLENFEKINDQVQDFVDKIRRMNGICTDMTTRIQSNKERTRDLLKKTAVLQNEKKQLSAKQAYIDGFLEKYSLTDDETKALAGSQIDNTVSEHFFSALKRLMAIHRNVTESLKSDVDNLPLVEISKSVQTKLDSAYNVLYVSIQRECRLLNVEFLELKPTLYQSFEALQERIPLFERSLEEFTNARRSYIVRAFIDALTKGAKNGIQKPIEQLSNEPLRYVNDMLAWIHQATELERELMAALLRNCKPEIASTYQKRVICTISEALCQPLKLRVEQTLSREQNCVILYRLSSLFLFYERTFESSVNSEAVLFKTLRDLRELSSNMFFSAVNSTVQRITSHMGVPDYDLLPVNAVNQALLLLRDILESQNDGAFTAVSDKKETYGKIFAHILDPLNQSIQLVCSNLHNALDVAVYMLNCLNAIKSVIILYQYTDTKLEMIKAQIDANEDVLVSEQASSILSNTGLMDIYTKCLAHQPNQGPLSKIAGMEPDRVANTISMFDAFLNRPEGYQCSQTVKISSARIRENVQKRTFENVISAYGLIYDKIRSPDNQYPPEITLKTVDEVKAQLLK